MLLVKWASTRTMSVADRWWKRARLRLWSEWASDMVTWICPERTVRLLAVGGEHGRNRRTRLSPYRL